MRIVFLGSPDFALPTLERLIASEHEIVAVYTQPDRPSGRGRKLVPPLVKTLALAHGLDVRQPKSISHPEVVEGLRQLAPDLGVIAAYGQILRQPVLDVPPLGVLNVHASLLPRWRGAAPIPAAILAADGETGATVMRVRLTLDAGPILGAARVAVLPSDTTATLTPRIAEAGAALLIDVLPAWQRGQITPIEQDESQVTYASQIEKDDAHIHWALDDAHAIERKVRAYYPWPIAFSHIDGEPLRILEATPHDLSPSIQPGVIFPTEAGFGVAAARSSAISVITAQGSGGKPMSAAAYLRGHPQIIGKHLE